MDSYETGRISDVQPKRTKEGTPYLSLKIDGSHFTCWDEDLFTDLQEGTTLEYKWKPSGRFKRITEFRRTTRADDLSASNGRRITRMNALRTAAMLYANDSIDDHSKHLSTLSSAMFFELYLLDEEPLRTLARDYRSRLLHSFREPSEHVVDTPPGGSSDASSRSADANPLHTKLVDRILSDELDRLSHWLYE